MKFYTGLGSKVKMLFISSPAKKQPLNGENPDTGLEVKSKQVGSDFSIKSPDFGSKQESFFDSRPWLDSDCEDDFYSVNGEFTPSRGSTPNYQTSILATSLNKALFIQKFPEAKSESSSSETSPTGRKKLAQLLLESLQREQASNEDDADDSPPKPIDGTPYMSGTDSLCSSEVTSNRKKVKRGNAMNCCLPSLVHSFSFNERRQKMSPGPRSA